jgi:dienelactone hydrolase
MHHSGYNPGHNFGLGICRMNVARIRIASTLMMLTVSLSPIGLQADGTREDYTRANGLRERYQQAAIGTVDAVGWIGKTNAFWYRHAVKGGNEFVVVDAATQQKRPAFDHAKLAESLSKATGRKYTTTTLPFNTLTFADDERAIDVRIDQTDVWTCTLADYVCKKPDLSGFRRRAADGLAPTCDAQSEGSRKSPDGKFEARINDYNVVITEIGAGTSGANGANGNGARGAKAAVTRLSTDGSDGNCYTLSSLSWSPDSTKLAAYRTRVGFRRMVHYVESSPEDQLQPKHTSRFYAKPGDVIDIDQPVIFQLQPASAGGSAAVKQIDISNALFPRPYDLTPLVWRKDGAHLTFEYNQRGHQVYRIIEIDAATGAARTVLSEEPKTFFDYRQANGGLTDSGRKYRYDIAEGREIVWMSERDGWSHLYLFNGATGAIVRQITKGNWVVRGVQKVDEEKKQIWFSASGMDAGKDPYFSQFFRINFDGTGLTRLTTTDANHAVSYSSDMQFYADLYSRVDAAPVLELHRAADQGLVAEIEHGDLTALSAAGWKPPEVFTAPGRDGKTDIWGVIYTPTNFDPAKKYPVVESIYAGPQGSFVPKSFSAYSPMRALAELGFVVVQIDGMGTANRSKAFHDVAWKNMKDAGFEDRILWHKAFAAKHPWYDITRVGVYGTSAGGQNAMGALLFHPEFYKAAVSAAGCHDNRMDKIWWNEQWMGWPIGPQYSESSNVDNAWRLQGSLLLVVGEMDTNVDPSSTFQVVNQLIKHKKDFELLVVPGMGHGSGGEYGQRRNFDFFVRNLQGKMPPAWNSEPTPASTTAAQQ